jgi:nitroimidazol reductase NimA-like FMN-containing flavoprotein (pyridoxamine 5'-phosphate oxidase superfamily)
MKLGGLRLPGGSAVANARTATLALAAALSNRLTLTDDLAPGDEPGRLSTLTRAECYEVLRSATVGRFAYVARRGAPDIVPVNYILDKNDILIRSGPGPKLQAAERRDVVAFEVEDLNAVTRSGSSVVVVGRARRCSPAEASAFESLVTGPWARGPRRNVIRISPTRVTGRRIAPGE